MQGAQPHGTDACSNYRLPADGVDEAVLDALGRFYRDHHDLIADAVASAAHDHDAGVGDIGAELTAVEKELSRTNTAIDRYLHAFEDGELDVDAVKDRVAGLKDKITQLTARRELRDQLAHVPTMPVVATLDDMADARHCPRPWWPSHAAAG